MAIDMKTVERIGTILTIVTGTVALIVYISGSPYAPWVNSGKSNPAPEAGRAPVSAPPSFVGDPPAQDSIERFFEAVVAVDSKKASEFVVPEKRSARLAGMPRGDFPFLGGLPAANNMGVQTIKPKTADSFKVEFIYTNGPAMQYCYYQAVISTVPRGSSWLIDSIDVRYHNCHLL
ncbi:MAG: hypothetical protein WDN08_09765 [Rhizomicrobium sp.]